MVEPKILTTAEELNRRIEQYSKRCSDLRAPFLQIRKQWAVGNRSIFTHSGPARYTDLSTKYKDRKQKKLGSAYPILRGATQTLEKAVTDEKDSNFFSKVEKTSLELGVQKTQEFPYALAQHYGRPEINLPARPYVLLGVEQVANKEQRDNIEVYLDIIEDFIIDNFER